jgi:16S rRNA (cytosine1402-N4)-methyltransferase
MQFKHTPVLLKETTELLNVKEGKTFVDCTLGGGGHTEEIKVQCPKSKVVGVDMDQEALDAAKERLVKYKNIEYVKDNFKNIKNIIKKPVDGVLFDLGVSSYQVDQASRGFSLQKDGPLDMRMDKSQKLTAEEIVNNFKPDELERIFSEYGEERFSRRIAKAIAAKREINTLRTTFQLKQIIEEAIPTWKKRESATRVFQALRIAVNRELDNLKTALQDAIELLAPGGRIVVISYHSLEDRIVKQIFRKAKEDGKIQILTKKPIRPSAGEISSNPRAKSAKLRAGERI